MCSCFGNEAEKRIGGIKNFMTEEEIKQLKTENDQLRQAKQELTDNIASRESRITELEKQVETAKNETAAMQKKATELDDGLNATRDSLGKTVAGYRSLTAHANPEIPAEMIIGDTLEAIEMAVAGARTIIGKVKEQLESPCRPGTHSRRVSATHHARSVRVVGKRKNTKGNREKITDNQETITKNISSSDNQDPNNQ